MEELKKSLRVAKETAEFMRQVAKRGRTIEKKPLQEQLEFLNYMENFISTHSDYMNEKKLEVQLKNISDKRRELEVKIEEEKRKKEVSKE
jgi:hypothetical protein